MKKKLNLWMLHFGVICSILLFTIGISLTNTNYATNNIGVTEYVGATKYIGATEYAYDEAYNLKDTTACTATTVTINGVEYDTYGNTFYISDIDGLLTLSAIVGALDTSNTGHIGCGFDNSLENGGIANSMAGATIVLLNDIDYNPGFTFGMDMENGSAIINGTGTPVLWQPIGPGWIPTFSGTFDGDDYVISGLYMIDGEYYLGLFGYIKDAEIKNIGVENSYIYCNNYNSSNVGGIVGYAKNSIIENCFFNGNLSANYNIGGIVGVCEETEIISCYNAGNIMDMIDAIYKNVYMGGIVGSCERTEITSCYNTGNILNITVENSYLGGIVGKNDYTTITIDDCYNTGNVSGGSFVGGIIGCTTISATVRNCYNEGNITGINCVGGIIGVIEAYTPMIVNPPVSTFSTSFGSGSENEPGIYNLNNYGDISGSGTDIIYVGGIVGKTASTLRYCYNEGNVSGSGADIIFVGGIAGEMWNLLEFCCNKGNIYGSGADTIYIGGIAGSATDSLDFCCNEGNIYGSGADMIYIGGIVGEMSWWWNLTLTNSNNSGNIYATCTNGESGGIAGILISTALINCYNTGNVSGVNFVGGIVGVLFADSETSKCLNCYNAGKVDGTGNYIGGIVGYNEGQLIENCFNTGIIKGGSRVGGIVGYNVIDDENVLGVEYCYNKGSVVGQNYVGGLIGYNRGVISNSHNSSSVRSIGDGFITDTCGSESVTYGGIIDKLNDYRILHASEFYFDLSYWQMQGTYLPSLTTEIPEHSVTFNLINAIKDEGDETCWFSLDYTAEIFLESDNLILAVSRNGELMIENVHYTFNDTTLLIYGEYIVGDIVIGTLLNQPKQFDLKNATGCTETTVVLNGVSYNTNGREFYISDIDGLLSLAAIVGKLDTSLVGPADCGFDNSNGYANSMQGATITLTKNLTYNPNFVFDMNLNGEIIINNEIDDDAVPYYWTPIGSLSYPFSGIFDGRGYNLYGLIIDSTDDYVGLFGYSLGIIKNISMQNSFIKGNNYVGAIAGFSAGSIESCYNNGCVSALDYTGGIVGSLEESRIGSQLQQLQIINSCNIGKIYGLNIVGGIVGQNSGGKIENCYNTGEITCKEFIVGGITGRNLGEMSEISNSYNTANISGNRAGGLAGYNYGTILSSYNTGTITGTYLGGLVSCNRGVIEASHNSGIPSKFINLGTQPSISCGIESITHESAINKLNEYVLNFDELNLSDWQLEEIYLTIFNPVTLDLKDATACTETTVTIKGNEYETDGNTFYISDIDGLLSLSAIVGALNTSNTGYIGCGFDNSLENGGIANSMAGATIILLNNLDYNPNFVFEMDTETGEPIIKDRVTGELTSETPISWLPIGDYYGYYDEALDDWFEIDLAFKGIFDGDNHKISGLYINEDRDESYLGLFGYICDAEIKNVGIENSYICGDGYFDRVGGIASSAQDSIIENCYNSGNISGYVVAGGIVGESFRSLIMSCYNEGNIIADGSDGYAGGIVGNGGGEMGISTIIECYNTGIIMAYRAGGIVSFGSMVSNSYNEGKIVGAIAGGIIGYADYTEITNCYNSGQVNGEQYAGGIVGENRGNIIMDCYNVGNVAGTGGIGGITGETRNNTIINCYNAGNISGIGNIGGIAGSSSMIILENCYNNGEIEGEGNVGGITGLFKAAAFDGTTYLLNCYNTSSVVGTNAGGIAGSIHTSMYFQLGETYVGNAIIDKCYNNASIFGINIGGIVGHITIESNESFVIIRNCYNVGNLSLNNEGVSVGGLVGFADNLAESDSVIINSHNCGLVNGVPAIFGNLVSNGSSVIDVDATCGTDEIDHNGIIEKLNNYVKVDYVGELSLFYWKVDEPYFTTEEPEENPQTMFDLKFATACTETTVTINGIIYETDGNTFYISDIDGLLSLSAIVGALNTSNTGYIGCGFDNSLENGGIANSMAGATIILLNDIDYNPNFIFEMNADGSSNISHTSGETLEPILWLSIGIFDWDYDEETEDWIEKSFVFKGAFDGDNHKISGLYINEGVGYLGLFGFMSEAEVKNVGIENSYIGGDYCVGGIAGFAEFSTIENCYNMGNINASNENGGNSGGIVGYAYASTITECYNTGNINASNENGGNDSFNGGGIVGYAEACIITKCFNSGNINTAGSNYGGNSGGIAGCIRETIMTDSNNEGNIQSDLFAGGIVGVSGEVWGSEPSNWVVITGCYNSGEVTVYNVDTGVMEVWLPSAAGILGCSFDPFLILTDCHNVGNITGTAVSDWAAIGVGGITGFLYGTEEVFTIFENCSNTGKIEGSSNSYNCWVGGIAGKTWVQITIKDCFNTGEIIGEDYVGGIVGESYNGVINCYNTGNVSGSGYCTGGIVGRGGNVINCYNSGMISGTDNVGGIAGEHYSDGIENCYNAGIIEGVNAGGIVGKVNAYGNTLNISNCYNIASVNGTNAGGIIGSIPARSYSYGNQPTVVTITNCYNVAVISGTNSGGIVGNITSDTTYGINTITITNCYNNANITGTTNAEGIVGVANNLASSDSIITGSHNSGLVNEAEATTDNLVGSGIDIDTTCGTDEIDHTGIIAELNDYVENYEGEEDLLSWREEEPYLIFIKNEE